MKPFKKANIGPQNEHEKLIFAAEQFRIDTQHEIQKLMHIKEVDELDLATKLNLSYKQVKKYFSDEYDLSLREVAKIYYVLGEECHIKIIK